jgi:molecular chaperone DnaK (HSP70)
MADVANNSEFENTKFSSGANKKQDSQIDRKIRDIAELVPYELFSDLDLMKIEDENKFKLRVAKHFNLDVNHILTFDELNRTPVGKERKWNIIVAPGDGDDAAFRPDVKDVLLVQH